MQTIKTAVVVVLLLGVCYGAYVAINAPDPILTQELEDWSAENGDLGPDVVEGSSLSIDIPQLEDGSASDLNPLTPPKLSTLGSTTATATASGALATSSVLSDTPSLPQWATNSHDTPAPTNASSVSAGLSLPPELEGSSVPLPGFESPSSSSAGTGLTASTKALNADLPGIPGMTADFDASNGSSAVPLPGMSNSPTSTAGLLKGISTGNSVVQNGAKPEPAKLQQSFKPAREEAIRLANEGKLREALAKMSPYYNHIDLTREEQADLVDLLDALAGEVIYSKRHLLDSPFIVNPGETFESVANRFRISPETLASINGMSDSKVLLAGTKLKVINGPMRAEVNLTRGELTLFLQDMYAGRFPISVGKDPAPIEGTYQIIDRRRDRTYYGAKTQLIVATDGRNPYGGYWMNLGQEMSIHGSAETTSPELANAGCISLAPLDAREVYSLLTQNSQVTIHR